LAASVYSKTFFSGALVPTEEVDLVVPEGTIWILRRIVFGVVTSANPFNINIYSNDSAAVFLYIGQVPPDTVHLDDHDTRITVDHELLVHTYDSDVSGTLHLSGYELTLP
jgi:hypothetical protein